jgi:hypothetical protein
MCRNKAIIILVFIVIASFVFTNQVSADWKVGNRRPNAYGVKANIWTPSNPLYIEESGVSNWVSIPPPYWLQAGWHYYKNWPTPERYVEYCVSPCQNPDDHDIISHGAQSWGTIVEYKVDHYTSTTWCASIDGVLKICKITQGAPLEMQVFSEVHNSPDNQLNTRFSNVYYKTVDNRWLVFDQELWREPPPYYIQKDHPYFFNTYRGSRILFVPIAIK